MTLPNGAQITMKEVRGAHKYTVVGDSQIPEGMELPSVTTMLNVINKPALIGWAKNQALNAYERALDLKVSNPKEVANSILDGESEYSKTRGTNVHAELTALAIGDIKVSDLSPELQASGTLLLNWLRQNAMVDEYIELPVYAPYHNFAGTTDIIGHGFEVGRKTARPFIIDLKTSKNVYPEHFAQVMGYERLASHVLDWKYETSIDCDEYVLRVGEDGLFEPYKLNMAQRKAGWNLMSTAARLWQAQQHMNEVMKYHKKQIKKGAA